ncbi:translation initiation factor IF-3, mitochondrial-like [Dama dama]
MGESSASAATTITALPALHALATLHPAACDLILYLLAQHPCSSSPLVTLPSRTSAACAHRAGETGSGPRAAGAEASQTSPRSHCFNPGPTLTKELTFSSNIGQHDLDTKSKQIQQWIEKKYKVQITVKKVKSADKPENKTEEMCNRIVQTMSGIATFSSRPQPIRGGKAVMCVLCPLSKKEEAAWRAALGTPRGDTLYFEADCLAHKG